MRPSPESVAAFSVFASDNGLDVTTGGGHGEWMSFTTNISHANTLFAASFQQFQHHTAASPITRTLSYSLPFALADHVDTVYPMTTFGAPRARRIDAPVAGAFTKRQQPDSVDPAPIVPASLQLLYNIPLSAKDPADISILITGYGQDVPQINDTAVSSSHTPLIVMLMDWVQAFLAHFRPDLASNTTVNIIPLNGGLDTQYLEAAKYAGRNGCYLFD
jgi:tripeptidyl-peptidase-1